MAKNTSNLWENDPSLVPMTPKRAAAITKGVFMFHRGRGTTEADYPGSADDKKAYGAWLKDNPAQATAKA